MELSRNDIDKIPDQSCSIVKKKVATLQRELSILNQSDLPSSKHNQTHLSNKFEDERITNIKKRSLKLKKFIRKITKDYNPVVKQLGHSQFSSSVVQPEDRREEEDKTYSSVKKSLLTRDLMVLKNVFESEEDSSEDEEFNTFYFLSTDPNYTCFKAMLDLQIAFSVLFLPLAFILRATREDSFELFNETYCWFVLILVADSLFPIDVGLSFFRAEEYKGEFVTDKVMIVVKYLISYFVVDVIASIPLSFFLCSSEEWSNNFSIYFTVWAVVFCRFIKLFDQNSTFKKIDIYVKPVSNRLLKFILLFLVFMHIFSCFFILLFSAQKYQIRACLSNTQDTLFSQYFSALYYSFASVLTVGYGDISPCTQEEKVFALIFIITGAVFYSVLISLLSTVFAVESTEKKKINEQLDILRDINMEFELDHSTYLRIREHVQNNVAIKSKYFVYLITELPVNLRKQLMKTMYQNVLMNINIFKSGNEEVIFFILPNLILVSFNKNEILVEQNGNFYEVYIQHKGNLEIKQSFRGIEIEIGRVKEDFSLGEFHLASLSRSDYQVVTQSAVQTFVLDRMFFYELLAKFSSYTEELVKFAKGFNDILESRSRLASLLLKAGKSKFVIREGIKVLNEVIFGFAKDRIEFLECLNVFKRNEKKVLKDVFLIFNAKNVDTAARKQKLVRKQMSKIKENSQVAKKKSILRC